MSDYDEVQTSITNALTGIEPLDRWARIEELENLVETALRDARAQTALDLHADLKSWRQVGEKLGVSAQRAWQISRKTR